MLVIFLLSSYSNIRNICEISWKYAPKLSFFLPWTICISIYRHLSVYLCVYTNIHISLSTLIASKFSVRFRKDLGLPRWLRCKESASKCRRPGFSPWVGKIPWRREWQPTPVFLPGEFHRQRNLVGYIPWGSKESDTTEQLTLSLFTQESFTYLYL